MNIDRGRWSNQRVIICHSICTLYYTLYLGLVCLLDYAYKVYCFSRQALVYIHFMLNRTRPAVISKIWSLDIFNLLVTGYLVCLVLCSIGGVNGAIKRH